MTNIFPPNLDMLSPELSELPSSLLSQPPTRTGMLTLVTTATNLTWRADADRHRARLVPPPCLRGLHVRRACCRLTAHHLCIRHDRRSATHLHRPTHGPELHRTSTGKCCHRWHASGEGNDAQDNQSFDTKCWDKPSGNKRRAALRGRTLDEGRRR